MHIVQEKLLNLSKRRNLAKLSLREMGRLIGFPNSSPQIIKHHLLQLQKKGFITLDRERGFMDRTNLEPNWAKGLLKKTKQLFSIPIIGTANCGPQTIFAEENFQGFLKISNKLVGKSKPDGLFAIKADGSSMNKAEVDGKRIEDGDYIIVDSLDINAKTGDVILAIIDNQATVKRLINDRENQQIVLVADSSFDYEPIYIHQDDQFLINGKVIMIIKKPRGGEN